MYYEKQRNTYFPMNLCLISPLVSGVIALFFVDHVHLSAAGYTGRTIHSLPRMCAS